jgi:hypothetical protein
MSSFSGTSSINLMPEDDYWSSGIVAYRLHLSIRLRKITDDLMHLPQVAETDIPQTQDAPGEFVLYDEYMTRVYVADTLTEERSINDEPISCRTS